jgi:hypothetical protein
MKQPLHRCRNLGSGEPRGTSIRRAEIMDTVRITPSPSTASFASLRPPSSWHSLLRGGIITLCTFALIVSIPVVDAASRDQPQYIVDGLALGDPVAPGSAAYREYKCGPSEQFASFTWCQRRRTEMGKFGVFASVNSILHSQNRATAYVSRYIEPAFFEAGDIQREIERLSQLFGSEPHVLRSPRRLGGPEAIIAHWGDVTLAACRA